MAGGEVGHVPHPIHHPVMIISYDGGECKPATFLTSCWFPQTMMPGSLPETAPDSGEGKQVWRNPRKPNIFFGRYLYNTNIQPKMLCGQDCCEKNKLIGEFIILAG